MTSRLFTFGCSFTRYNWPTWADVMSQEFDYFENWGLWGGGNHFIFYSLIEAIERRNINKNDTVAIMFTGIGREDRFLKGRWAPMGSVYNSRLGEKYVEEFTDPTGFFVTNLAVINGIVKLLQNIGCRYHLFSMVPLSVSAADDSFLNKILPLKKDIETQVADLYKDSLKQIKPSVFEIIFNNDWYSRSNILIPSDTIAKTKPFRTRYNECAGPNWPKFDDFMSGNIHNIDKDIIDEIGSEQFNFFNWRDKIVNTREDNHPIPAEHMEYLKRVGFNITERQENFVYYWNQRVLTNETVGWENKPVKRF